MSGWWSRSGCSGITQSLPSSLHRESASVAPPCKPASLPHPPPSPPFSPQHLLPAFAPRRHSDDVIPTDDRRSSDGRCTRRSLSRSLPFLATREHDDDGASPRLRPRTRSPHRSRLQQLFPTSCAIRSPTLTLLLLLLDPSSPFCHLPATHCDTLCVSETHIVSRQSLEPDGSSLIRIRRDSACVCV